MAPTFTERPFTRAFPAVRQSVPEARHAVARYLTDLRTADPPLGDIAIVLTEAVANVVLHAYREGDPGEVRVQVELSDDEVQLVVEDDGGGLAPRVDSPGLGLGLPLIATLSERFDTTTVPGRGTRLSVWFRRGAKVPPAGR